MLLYLTKLVIENDDSLLSFKNDLVHIADAEGVILDSLGSELKNLQGELARVHKTAMSDADRLCEQADLNGGEGVEVDSSKGRTSMEKFTLSAAEMVEEAVQRMAELKEKYADLLRFFGEDEKMASNDFFGIMKRFVAAFDTAAEQAQKEAKAKVRLSVQHICSRGVNLDLIFCSPGEGTLEGRSSHCFNHCAC